MSSARTPAEVFHPGEFIREEIEARGWKQEDLAKIMGRPLQAVNELIVGKKQITPETALGLAKAFGDDDALYWMKLDNIYRLSKAKPIDDSVSRRAKLYSIFPVREMIKRKWIEESEYVDFLKLKISMKNRQCPMPRKRINTTSEPRFSMHGCFGQRNWQLALKLLLTARQN
jgi:HTH-type transcriptional regulator / antitoxin HigA